MPTLAVFEGIIIIHGSSWLPKMISPEVSQPLMALLVPEDHNGLDAYPTFRLKGYTL